MSISIRDLNSAKNWDYENGYYWFSDVRRIAKSYSQLRLYQQITAIPGDIMEFGVYKAASLVRFLSAREMFESAIARRVVAFDAFGTFPRTGNETIDEQEFLKGFEGGGGDGLGIEEVQKLLEHKRISQNVSLVKGDIFNTLPEYLANNPHARIALLHIDVDLYAPTKFILETAWPYMSRGGVVLFDDYGLVGAATQAIDEFLVKHPELKLARDPYTNTPTYLFKVI